MEQIRVIRKQIVMDLDVNEAPSNPRWIVDRVLNIGGVERVIPDTISLTVEEMQTHIGQALTAQAADIAADAAEREVLRGKLADALAALRAVAEADASWDAGVRSSVAEVLQENA